MGGVARRLTKPLPPHDFEEGETPGVCRHCPLPWRHGVHNAEAVVAHRKAEEQKGAQARAARLPNDSAAH